VAGPFVYDAGQPRTPPQAPGEDMLSIEVLVDELDRLQVPADDAGQAG
jgi:hypothetical protein